MPIQQEVFFFFAIFTDGYFDKKMADKCFMTYRRAENGSPQKAFNPSSVSLRT